MRTIAVLLFCASVAAAQEASSTLHEGAWDFGLWAAGGHSVPGGTSGTTVFDAGLRIGKVLTREHLSGILRGNFEYAVDLIPLYLVHTGDTRYAAGFDPVILKWNFTSGRHVAPYAEFGGGVLFSKDNIPRGTNNVNFTPQASVGLQFFTQRNRAVVVAAKYVHISNAGLATPNPGINTLQFAIGYHWFR
ncbi:MAG: acyloxyacyl hydrolase [Acidobacteria bacterium]|nr:acyloxyacyl hydrolase [Acidobacteriota bacterium]